jgi:Ca-activated chloride channel family protein
MKFLWFEMLWGALLLPLLVVLYVWLMRRRKKAVVHYPGLSLVRDALGKSHAWRRHVPPALLLVALAALIVAGARPSAVMILPTQSQTIVMAMDVSGSMRATDVDPDRITASRAAAREFVGALPASVRIGIVAYSGTALLVQAPTHNRDDVLAAIDRFFPQRGTAIGSGLLVALDTLFPEAHLDASMVSGERNPTRALPRDDHVPTDTRQDFTPVPPGSYEEAAILLMTDGQNTTGPDPMQVAQLAADRGVKVFTVGFGTEEGEVISIEGWRMRVRLDEATLKKIANLTHGEYFRASSGASLKSVYEVLKSRLLLEKRQVEITALFAYAAALLMLAAAGLSLWWFGRVA